MNKIFNIKKGQLCTINNTVYQARERDIGCSGCSLDSITACPNIGGKKIECTLNNIILIRLCKKVNITRL